MERDIQKLFSHIDASTDRMTELETLLNSIPAVSPGSGGTGELDKCAALEEWLRAHGIDRLERFDAADPRAKGGIRPNLVATVPGLSDGFRVWIIAHMDVVPEGELSLWKTDPWKVAEKDGKLYGRGVEDNQQGLVSGIFAALAYIENGAAPAYTLKLLFAADEEEGSEYGIDFLLKEHDLFRQGDIIIIPDGGDCEGASIEVAEKNILWLEVKVHGRQTHGSRPDEGVNAHLAGCELAVLLNDMERHFDGRDALFEPPYSTFQPTKKEGNVPNINTIPGEDVFYMDCRILPMYTLDTVRSEIGRRIKIIEAKYGVKIETAEYQAVESPATAADAPVVKKLQAAVKQVYGVDARPVGIGGGTVGAYLRRKGFDAAVWARMDETAHQPNEYVKLENLAGDAKVFAAVLFE